MPRIYDRKYKYFVRLVDRLTMLADPMINGVLMVTKTFPGRLILHTMRFFASWAKQSDLLIFGHPKIWTFCAP